MRVAFALVAMALLGHGSAASARSLLASFLAYPAWQVEAGADAGNEVTAARGTVITRARLLPVGVVVVQQDAVSAIDGTVLVPSGTALSLYRTAGGEAFCAARMLRKLSGKVPCLIDGDRDGSFDRAMRILIVDGAGPFRGGVIVRGAPVPIRPVERIVRDPSDYPSPQRIQIVMTGAGRNNASFEVVLETDGKPMPIRGLNRGFKGALPLACEVFGAHLAVLSLDHGKAQIRVEQPIPKQPFLLTAGLI